ATSPVDRGVQRGWRPPDAAETFARLKRSLTAVGIRVRYFAGECPSGVLGIYNHPDDIRICPQDARGEFSTLAHEAAHAFLFRLEPRARMLPESIHELVAETVARRTMTVLGFGLDPANCRGSFAAVPVGSWQLQPLIDAVSERVLAAVSGDTSGRV